MMKKVIKISVISILAIVLMMVVVWVTLIGGQEITNGKYEIEGCKEYPDAYIEVNDGKIQFYNIDLNEIYQEYQTNAVKKIMGNNSSIKISDEEMEELSDLNRKFVSNPYTIEYDEDQKAGTFTYTHFCMSDQGLFGLVLRYDSLHKTIEIKSPVRDIVFKKKSIIG